MDRVALSDFSLIQRIGQGAAGEVWRCQAQRDLSFARQGENLAVKIYRPEILREPNQQTRILREFCIGTRLTHPNLVRMHYVDLDSDKPFLVMEWCDGQDLRQWCNTYTVEDEFLLQFAVQMLEVLEFLHSSRVVHRDVKPTNIHVDTRQRIRLLDYGIIMPGREGRITEQEPARFVGTYRYAPPEYITRRECNPQTDIYALGAVFYFLLYGKEIFAEASRTVDIVNAKKQHNLNFPVLDDKGPVWQALRTLAREMLAAQASERPASAMACLDGLAAAVPDCIPLRAYLACSLTRPDENRRRALEALASVLNCAAEGCGFSLYKPADRTSPRQAPTLGSEEVYWIDRERVANSDLLVVLAEEPSFGVGQEAEIAANAGVPIVVFHSQGVPVSRMLLGVPAPILKIVEFSNEGDLEEKAREFFRTNRNRLSLARRTRERQYHLRVGNRVRDLREEQHISIEELREKSGVAAEQLQALEGRPEQVSNLSLVQLRRIARALRVSPAELLRDQSGKDQEFEQLYRDSLHSLRSFAKKNQLSYAVYEDLKRRGRAILHGHVFEAVAHRGRVRAMSEADWWDLYSQSLRGSA